MDNKRPLSDDRAAVTEKTDIGSDQVSKSDSQGGNAPQELALIEKLLKADWRGRWGKPLSAEDLLMIGRSAFEPLFHEPPIGPIPEYLAPHLAVHGCVTEYEQKLEELDRWKALQLSRWMQNRVGRDWCVAGKVYQLQAEKKQEAAPEKFWFSVVEGLNGCVALNDKKSERHVGSAGASELCSR